eukprot:scaffold119672_cov14-Tisochrysis_lutea.AAC.1
MAGAFSKAFIVAILRVLPTCKQSRRIGEHASLWVRKPSDGFKLRHWMQAIGINASSHVFGKYPAFWTTKDGELELTCSSTDRHA